MAYLEFIRIVLEGVRSVIINCPICKKDKDSVGPKIVGKENTVDVKLQQPQLSLTTVVMCNECLDDYKQGKIKLNIVNK